VPLFPSKSAGPNLLTHQPPLSPRGDWGHPQRQQCRRARAISYAAWPSIPALLSVCCDRSVDDFRAWRADELHLLNETRIDAVAIGNVVSAMRLGIVEAGLPLDAKPSDCAMIRMASLGAAGLRSTHSANAIHAFAKSIAKLLCSAFFSRAARPRHCFARSRNSSPPLGIVRAAPILHPSS
jgi:hypothetical protein